MLICGQDLLVSMFISGQDLLVSMFISGQDLLVSILSEAQTYLCECSSVAVDSAVPPAVGSAVSVCVAAAAPGRF